MEKTMFDYRDYEKRESFRQRLTSLVEDEDIPKYELVKKIGISQLTLSKALLYGIIPKTKTLTLIADYFEVSVDYLLCRRDDPFYLPSVSKQSFYDRIQYLKQRKGFSTDYALAKDSHLPRQYFGCWEKKGYLPTVEILEYLADYFEVSVDYLLGRCD